MAAADPVFESFQHLQSMMESFDESLSQLCKDNSSESALDLRKNLMEYYHDLHKALQSRYETLKIKEKIPEEPRTRGTNKESKKSKVTGSSPASSSFSKVVSSVEVRPEIETLCDKADGHGLRIYIVDNLKEVEILRNELLVALGKAPDAAKIVIKALEGCDLSNREFHSERNESLASANGKACGLLLESLYPVFGNDDSDAVPSDIKDSAREIAKVWWKELKIENKADSARRFDVQPFLQLLSTFRLAADYEKEELWELVCTIMRRKKAPELCRSLGLSSKVPDVIHKLSNERPNMALRYAHVCGMMDKIDPVVLLTSYLRGVEESAKVLLTNGHGSIPSQNNANAKMVSALENVIGLIKEYGLQSDFCEDDLQNKLKILVQENKDLKRKRKTDAKRKAQEKEDRKKAAEKKAREEEDREKAAEKKAQEKEDRDKAAEKKAQETEDRKKAAEKRLQHKRRQSFEPGYGPSERENYASKMAKLSSPNETTRVAGGMGNSKASPYNIDGVQNKSGIIGHDQRTSAFSAANRSSTGLAVGAFTSAPSIAAQINDERRCHPSAFGRRGPELYTSAFGGVNTGSIGSSLYGSNSRPIPSDVNQGGHERSIGQYSGFAGRNMVPIESSGYGPGVFTVPPSNVTQGHFESRSVIDRYRFNSGLTSLPPA